MSQRASRSVQADRTGGECGCGQRHQGQLDADQGIKVPLSDLGLRPDRDDPRFAGDLSPLDQDHPNQQRVDGQGPQGIDLPTPRDDDPLRHEDRPLARVWHHDSLSVRSNLLRFVLRRPDPLRVRCVRPVADEPTEDQRRSQSRCTHDTKQDEADAGQVVFDSGMKE